MPRARKDDRQNGSDTGERRLELMPLDDLLDAPVNPKKHDRAGIGKGIDQFGLIGLPTIDERTGRLVAGHGRRNDLKARRDQGLPPPARSGVKIREDGVWMVPVDRGWASLNEHDATAAGMADNQATISGGWDPAAALDTLVDLTAFDTNLADAIAFGDDDIAALRSALNNTPAIGGLPGGGDTPNLDDEPPVPEDVPAITKPGDMWILGPHRLLCGDCRNSDDVNRLLADAAVNLAFTSPPYAEQRAYDPKSGFKPIPPDQYVEWFEPVAANVAARLADDGSWFVNIKEHADDGQRVLYVKDLTLAHARRWGWRFVDEFCWTRQGVPGKWANRFKNGWEPIFHFCRKPQIKLRHERVSHDSSQAFAYSPDHPKSVSGSGLLGAGNERVGGYLDGLALPSNVLTINTGGVTTVAGHSAAFPVALPRWFIKAYTDPGDVVYDPFVGSGSTLLAAQSEGRVGYGMEISPAYCDVIARRWQGLTGQMPARESGEPVDFIGTAAA